MHLRISTATLALLAAACTKGTPEPPQRSNAGATQAPPAAAPIAASPREAGAALLPFPAHTVTVQPGKLIANSTEAEAIGTEVAQRRWPDLHVRMASAERLPQVWKVFLEFQEQDSNGGSVGGHVILDPHGAFVDGGTSTGLR